MRELLGLVDRFHLSDEDLAALGDGNARQGGDLRGALADDAGVQRAVDEDGLADLVQLIAAEEVAAAPGKLRANLVVDAVEHDDRLLGRADHAVVEGLGMDD